MAKQIERICKNCKLYDPKKAQCSVIILHQGMKLNLPVDPEDSCFYEESYFDPTSKAIENFAEDLKEVKIWVEDKNGQKTGGDGVVKIEYPEGFFGRSLDDILGD